MDSALSSPSSPPPPLPTLIQGGMGVGVSHWRLARAVAQTGQLGVVSGTALNTVLLRRLQDGDPTGDLRRALAHCPLRAAAEAVLARYFIPGGKAPRQPYRLAPLFTVTPAPDLVAHTVVANFVEVFLAKEGHAGPIGLNLLEKIQMATLASLYGAMLAGVDYVLMGAGIPRTIPGVLDGLAAGRPAELRLATDGAPAGAEPVLTFDPSDLFFGAPPPALHRPRFLAIVSSSALATTLARKSNGRVDGFIVEGASAGGHNAPPRGPLQLTPAGEPRYGPRDAPDLAAIRALGLPFWLAGSFADPAKLRDAQALGAVGVQLGTAFAFCAESGLREEFKTEVLHRSRTGTIAVRTDPRASPTGMPFKVIQLPDTVAAPDVLAARLRRCDLGYLRQPYRRPDGSTGYRCPAEPVADYVAKGGDAADTVGRACLCNGLLAAIGLAQTAPDHTLEPAILTAGDEVAGVHRFLAPGAATYPAAAVVHALLQPA